MIDGAKLGVLVMLGILFAVQGGFVGFFLYLRKRAKREGGSYEGGSSQRPRLAQDPRVVDQQADRQGERRDGREQA